MSREYIPTMYEHQVRNARVSSGEDKFADRWPPKMLEMAKREYEAGASASTVARLCNEGWPDIRPIKTRSAICGKAYRLHWVGNWGGKEPNGMVRRAKIVSGGPERCKPKRKPKVLPKLDEPDIERCEPLKAIAASPNRDRSAQTTDKRRLTKREIADRKIGFIPDIIDLKKPKTAILMSDCPDDCCKWPASDELLCMEVCGAKSTIGAYCDHHASLAYRIMPTRSRNVSYGRPQLEYKGSKIREEVK